MEKLGFVVIGYKNYIGIERLLSSLSKVDFGDDNDIPLIISIDYSGDSAVENVANNFEWKHGKKYVIAHSKNLGLKSHILACGDYMEKYELDAIAVLEDDIYVSPQMYSYMKKTVSFYKDNPKIAGISLYKHEYNICAKHPFDDYDDFGDTYFVQYAMSWGQIWLKKQWRLFREWYDEEKWKAINPKCIPKNLSTWKNSWLKYHIMYCIDKDLYFVYPRLSLTTDFSDVGTHNSEVSTAMQVKMCMNEKKEWVLAQFGQTRAVYDAFFENTTVGKFLNYDDLEVDLYGIKEYQDRTKYVISRKNLPYKILRSWGLYLRPIEANIFMDIPGKEIFLYDLSIPEKTNQSSMLKYRYFEYDLKGINILCVENIQYCVRFIARFCRIKLKKIKKKRG